MNIDAVIDRLRVQVPALRSVAPAADLMALLTKNALPQFTPAAHVVHAGLRGGNAQAAAGAFIQDYVETVGVVLTFRNNDAQGARGVTQAADIINGVFGALGGWAPEGAVGVFILSRGAVSQFEGTTMVYLLEFSIPLQMRIIA